MKLSIALALSAASLGNVFVAQQTGFCSATSLNAAKIYYLTSTGNTETIAGYIAKAAGGLETNNIGDASNKDITSADALILGLPTWNTGADEQCSGTSWDDWLYNSLPNLELDGKKTALFGMGDQAYYAEYYCDAVGEVYNLFTAKGAKVYGMTSTNGYNHKGSKAKVDGNFVGLLCDRDNQYNVSKDCAKAWVEQLKGKGFF